MNATTWLRASAIMASGTLVSRVLGFVKALLLAALLGVTMSGPADAFALANQLPNSLYAIILAGVLNAILVPQIVRASKKSASVGDYINRLITVTIVLVGVMTVLITFAAPALIYLYGGSALATNPEVVELATIFAYWCLPQIFFYTLFNVLGEVLNARKYFGPYMWAPALNNLIGIGGLLVFLWLFGAVEPHQTGLDYWTFEKQALLAGSFTFATVLQALVLFFFWRKIGLRFRFDFRWRGNDFGRIGPLFGWTFGAVVLSQIGAIVITQVAFTATGAGASVAALNTVEMITLLPHAIAAVSISTVFFTKLSEHSLAGELQEVRKDTSELLRIIGAVTVFSSLFLVVAAYPFSRFFINDTAQAMQLGEVMIAYTPMLIFFSFSFAIKRVFYAFEDAKTPFVIHIFYIGLLIAGVLASVLLPLEKVAVGIALATLAATALQAIIGAVLLRNKIGSYGLRGILSSHLKFLLAGSAAAASGFGVFLWLGGTSPDGFALGSQLNGILTTAMMAVVALLVYLIGLVLLRSEEFLALAQRGRARGKQ